MVPTEQLPGVKIMRKRHATGHRTVRVLFAGLWVLTVFPAVASVEVPLRFELSHDPVAVKPDADPFLRPENSRLWRPQPDQPFLQDWVIQVPTTDPVTSVAVTESGLFVISGEKLFQLDSSSGKQLLEVVGAPERVQRLFAPDGSLWVSTDDALFHLQPDGSWGKVADQPASAMTLHRGVIHASIGDAVYQWTGSGFRDIMPEQGYRHQDITYTLEDGTQILPEPLKFGPHLALASYSETIYGLKTDGPELFDGEAIVSAVYDWGQWPPGARFRDMTAIGNRLFFATSRGLAILRGMLIETYKGPDGLPVESLTCLAPGFARDLWIGSERGLIRYFIDENRCHYYGATHWLPDNHVHSVAVGHHTVAVATNGGLAVIRFTPTTLAEKAAYYEKRMDELGFKRMGFVHSLYRRSPDGPWIREISDNDGGWTAHYLAAMSFKYAATGDETARREAVNSFEAMAWLEEVTGVPGLIARAIWSPADEDTKAEQGSGGQPARWYKARQEPWEWKGDVSSDEVSAHFYAVTVFHHLAARGPEKQRAAAHLERISRHIITHGWKVIDADGRTTRWARWDPEYLQRPYGMYARGLNGMEAQAYTITAYAMTGDPFFLDGLRQLLDWGYHRYTVRQKLTFPPDDITPWDDELAFFCYFPLMWHTKDPVLRSIYARSLERSWAIKRMEKTAWFNILYGAMTGNDCDLDDAMEDLRAWPIDLREHAHDNSHRDDLYPEPGYPNVGGGVKSISSRESSAKRGSRSALPLRGGSGNVMVEPTGWLHDYWMARYYGMIQSPDSGATAASEPLPVINTDGAAPYQGPPRPPIHYEE